MRASSVTASPAGRLSVRDWAWWRLPGLVRAYVGAVPVVALVLVGLAASQTSWPPGDLARFGLLLSCGAISVVVTPRVAFLDSGLVRDFLSAWVLPVAILLPPVYAMLIPVPLLVLTQWRVHRGAIYRRVFTAAAIGLAYGAASLVFRAIPASFAGSALGTGTHPLTWTAAVAAAELTGWFGHNALIVAAVKLSDPTARVTGIALNREALLADFAQMDLGIIITVVVAVHPVLAVLAVPTVLLARRFMMHAQLLAKSRMDTKTGLLNASTWESEAEREIARAVRTRSPLCVALLDLDHFKLVNDTHGHLVGDKALRAISAVLREQMRSYDLAGRFGGEEFALLLPQTREDQALAIAERLRAAVAALSVPVSDSGIDSDHGSGIDSDHGSGSGPAGTRVRVTVSIGVAALDRVGSELATLLAAADAALYQAKQDGRNQTRVATGRPLAQIVPAARPASLAAARHRQLPPARRRQLPGGHASLVKGQRVVQAAQAARQRLLAPDDLAGRGPPGTPALGELAHDLQAAAVLVVAVGRTQPWQRARGVDYLADQRPLVDEPERDVAAGVLDRVGHQLGDEQLGRGDQVLQSPPLHRLGQHRTRFPDRGQLRRERP
jgi:diguanylate cyclase (GGDEF)-like protein